MLYILSNVYSYLIENTNNIISQIQGAIQIWEQLMIVLIFISYFKKWGYDDYSFFYLRSKDKEGEVRKHWGLVTLCLRKKKSLQQ